MTTDSDSAARRAELLRGTEEVIPEAEIDERLLASDRPLRIKAGFDPTAADLHLGHTLLLNKLRHFQDAGHHVLFLIGDFTATIGDPTGKNETRAPLTRDQVAANARTYQEQAFKILDADRTEVVFNSTWLDQLGAEGMIKLAAQHTVARMLERDDFHKRYQSHRPIAIHEFLYPLLQGYDSVALDADVELGGTDQKFNLLVGRHLQSAWGKRPQTCMTLPILEGLDGVQKMSKSLGNYIGVTEPPDDMFGKMMSISDDLMWRYYHLLSLRPLEEVARIRQAVDDGGNPRDAKVALAGEIVDRFHGSGAGARAAEAFTARFRNKELPDDIPEVQVAVGADGAPLPWVLREAGLVSSNSEGQRLLRQNAVRLDRERVNDAGLRLHAGTSVLVQVGKRNIAQVHLTAAA
ncbi:tyrosine--tRNA ligase [Algiphilus sp.]|uniref:tyrosine--tRNA ligase n=1 Tax=Algiphilus sp. TaxID=1872431 RepID=UPI0025C665DB|nr:tyrosine--tRNA ligase [Algiphilus sp.]MCK5769782.1 tyrosine--tRNA ligase [Algiphilus sp.]